MSENAKKVGLVETYPLLPVGIGFFGLALALVVAIFFVEAEASPQPLTTAIESAGAVEGAPAEAAPAAGPAVELMPVSANYKRLLNGLGALVMAVLGTLCVRYTGLKGEEE